MLKPPALLTLYSSHSDAFDQPISEAPFKGRAHNSSRYHLVRVTGCLLARLPVVSPMLCPKSAEGGSNPSMLCRHHLSSFKLKHTEGSQDTDHFHRLLEESSQGKVSPFYMEDEGIKKTAKPLRALQTVEKMTRGSAYEQ